MCWTARRHVNDVIERFDKMRHESSTSRRGAGMRLRGYIDGLPKPMMQLGSRPLLCLLMKYYAHFGPTTVHGIGVPVICLQ